MLSYKLGAFLQIVIISCHNIGEDDGQFHLEKQNECLQLGIHCRPKSEGGFGIRKLEDIFSAAGLKLFWRCFTTDSLWVSWMKMYAALAHFLGIQVHTPWLQELNHIRNSKNLAVLHIDTDNADSWLWTASKSGCFSFSSA